MATKRKSSGQDPDIDALLLGLYKTTTDIERVYEYNFEITSLLDGDVSRDQVLLLESHSEQAWAMLENFAEDRDNFPDTENLFTDLPFRNATAIKDHIQDKLNAEDLIRLDQWLIAAKQDQATGNDLLLRLYATEGSPPDVVLIRALQGQSFVMRCVAANFGDLVGRFVASNFDLTNAESEVLKALLVGGSLSQIADRMGKSVETLRSQTKSLRQKLDAGSQPDILRMVIQATALAQDQALPSDHTGESDLRCIVRPDGRKIFYEVDGPRTGRTLLYIHSCAAGRHWPETARNLAVSSGWQVIRVSRAGNGYSSINPKLKWDLLSDHILDYAAVLDAENINKVHLFANEDGTAIAYGLAMQNMERTAAIACYEVFMPVLKVSDAKHFLGIAKMGAILSLRTPSMFKLLVKISYRRIKSSLKSDLDQHPIYQHNFREHGDFEGELLCKRNDADLALNEGEGVWRDMSYVNIDWAYPLDRSNHRPTCHIITADDSPFIGAAAYETFAPRIGATIQHIPSLNPTLTAPLRAALEVFECSE